MGLVFQDGDSKWLASEVNHGRRFEPPQSLEKVRYHVGRRIRPEPGRKGVIGKIDKKID